MLLSAAPTHSSWAKLVPSLDDNGGQPDPNQEHLVQLFNDHLTSVDETTDLVVWQAELDMIRAQIWPLDPVCEDLVFAAPAESEMADLDCLDEMRGSEQQCEWFACHDQEPADSCDLADILLDETELPLIEVDPAINRFVAASAPEVTRAGWSILKENIDLIYWVGCMYYGSGGVGGCIADQLSQTHERPISLSFLDGTRIPQTGQEAVGYYDPGRHQIVFLARNRTVFNLAQSYAAGAGDSLRQFCDAAAFAELLLHELVHTCPEAGDRDNTPDGSDAAGQCTTSYLIQNAFMHSLGERYPCLQKCPNLDTVGSWGNDDS